MTSARLPLVALTLSLGVAVVVAQAPAPPTNLRIFATSGYLTNSNVYQVPAIARPALQQSLVDPVFGASVTRVSDPSMGSTLGYRHEYARLTAFNADGTMIVLIKMSTWDYQVLNPLTNAVVRTIPRIPCGNDPSVTWHRTDPDLMIFFCDNAIQTYRVSTNVVSTVMSFPQYSHIDTREEGTVSDDWHYVAFFGYGSSAIQDVVVADLWTKTTIARNSAIAFGDWVGTSPSGQYVVIQHDDTKNGTRVYDRNLNYLRMLHPDATHEDFAIDADGQEVMVWYAWSDAQASPFGGASVVVKSRLSDGQVTVLADTHWKWGSHVSGIGSRGRPGWVLLSDYKTTSVPTTNDSPFQQEIFWMKMDGSGAVERLAHHHSVQGSCNGSKDYWAEPHAVASWDGSHVLFASIWGSSPCTRYDTYIIGPR